MVVGSYHYDNGLFWVLLSGCEPRLRPTEDSQVRCLTAERSQVMRPYKSSQVMMPQNLTERGGGALETDRVGK